MKRILYILILFIVGFTITDIPAEHIVLDWKISQNLNDFVAGKTSLYFENAEYSERYSGLPAYYRSFRLRNDVQDYNFKIENADFEQVDEIFSEALSEHVTEEIIIEKARYKSADSYYAQLQILPFKKIGEKIYILKTFDLKYAPIKTKSVSTGLTYNWKSNSVLGNGRWIKISTSGKGIYKITYEKLTEWGFESPANVKVFGSGGLILSENPGVINYDDLEQNSVWHGSNNGKNCLFFYEPGNTSWSLNVLGNGFKHNSDFYADKGFYFLSEDFGTAKTLEKTDKISETPTSNINTFDAYLLHEFDLENLLKGGSGKHWFGEKFRNGTVKNMDFNLEGIDVQSDVKIRINAVARSFQSSEMPVSVNQADAGKINFYQVNTSDDTSVYADEREINISSQINNEQLNLIIKFFANDVGATKDDNALAWLDFIELNYRKKLMVSNEVLFFRDIYSVGEGNVVQLNIQNAGSGTKLLDVTEPNNIKELSISLDGSTLKSVQSASTLREYAVFNTDGNFPEPELVGDIENQNLHKLETPDFLIISHSKFLTSANALADFHRSYDGMDVEVVDAEMVYNEFSSGKKDATGIRNFIKMLYDRGNKLKYVLLFGDGSYDNKNINNAGKNYIPTFQSANSLNPVASFVTDDFFVILDNGESVYNGAVDLGIGRIPASTAFEAELVVNKIKNYYSSEALGDWRNVVCFIGDDEDGNLHMRDSEKLANYINDNHKEFITDKIYFDAFMEEATPAGERYPGVTEAINQRVKDGVLVLNYVGHANDRFMADEHVLDVSNINSWSNIKNLPIFVTATCEFSRFDADHTSAGEYVLFNPSGGGIGLFSTTRVVFAYSNFLLSQSFYNHVFAKNGNGEHYRMGDIMRLAKTNTINTTNKRNFSLLADPALKLSYPQNKVITSTINQQNASVAADTIGALQKITITGYIADNSGNKLNGFTGEITPTVYDKSIVMKTLGNGGETPLSFNVQENIIYKGLASVSNGEFTFSFVLPKDISYNLGKGKIVYYADNEIVDAHGAFEDFIIGGSGSQIADNKGPDIELYMDSPDFINGATTSKNPTMLAFLSDENGINTVGTGIGHDITLVIDGDDSNVLVLNNYYKADIDNYKSGSIQLPLSNLSVGIHKLRLKAWDVANNSTEVEIEFEVSGDFIISQVGNYPNPANDFTFFTFEHNQSGATLDAIIEVFDLNGRLVDSIKESIGSNGLNSNPLRWDIRELNMNLKNGIYIFRVTAQNNDGVIASKSGKMMISN